MKCASILNNVVAFDGDSAESVADYAGGESLSATGEKNEILVALEALVSL
jgi:uridine phosphorylase